ncbi:MAG: Flp pilus assembly complex ATPase component TadA [Candidatus Omnitrophica bacterium]|nr:Flp pilus assembly complex ATPase component TadA [Candidatus Omnitrophota bacterium]
MPQGKYLKLGELLIKEGLIDADKLEKAMLTQKQDGGRLGEILVKLGFVKEEQLVVVLGKQLNMPYFAHTTDILQPALEQGLELLISRDYAVRNLAIPLSRNLKSLTVAMFDPLDLILLDNIKKLTGYEINPVLATKASIMRSIEAFYGKSQLLKEAVNASYDIISDEALISVEGADQELSLDKLIASAEEAPVIKLVDLIIRQAIDEGASDIHVEPFKEKISLRYRIDGKLYEIPPPAKHLHLAIVSRIKIMAKLDIAEKRLPQDGAIMVRIEQRAIDIRVSIIPTIYGEKAVLRILDRSKVVLDLARLGFEPNQLELIRKASNSPYGLVFVTGPTGSGKSTTLYAILNEVKNPEKNIITIEDPVEYKLEGINQVQVKPEIGLNFAAALRSFLRQDPDVMLVGEVRDLETAQICIRSSLTGHLVLSTLHTNDAPSAITRLLDIGIEPYLLAPSLLLIVGQRLLRKLCPECKEAYEPSKEILKSSKVKAELIYRAKGCKACINTGYKGRVCIAEVMQITPGIQELITQQVSFQKIRELARQEGMQTLYESAVKKVEAGITSLEEALSVTLGAD